MTTEQVLRGWWSMDGKMWLLMGGLLVIVLFFASSLQRDRPQSDLVNKTFDLAGLVILAAACLAGVLWASS